MDRSGALPEVAIAWLLLSVTKGLVALHALNKVHRDIKPQNILYDTRGRIKITDFGIMASLERIDQNCKTFVGTIMYLSPERMNGMPYSFSSDVWAVGLTALTACLGKFGIDHESQFDLITKVTGGKAVGTTTLPLGMFSKAFESFIADCMAFEPSQRPTSEELLTHDLFKFHASALEHCPSELLEIIRSSKTLEKSSTLANSGDGGDLDRVLAELFALRLDDNFRIDQSTDLSTIQLTPLEISELALTFDVTRERVKERFDAKRGLTPSTHQDIVEII